MHFPFVFSFFIFFLHFAYTFSIFHFAFFINFFFQFSFLIFIFNFLIFNFFNCHAFFPPMSHDAATKNGSLPLGSQRKSDCESKLVILQYEGGNNEFRISAWVDKTIIFLNLYDGLNKINVRTPLKNESLIQNSPTLDKHLSRMTALHTVARRSALCTTKLRPELFQFPWLTIPFVWGCSQLLTEPWGFSQPSDYYRPSTDLSDFGWDGLDK